MSKLHEHIETIADLLANNKLKETVNYLFEIKNETKENGCSVNIIRINGIVSVPRILVAKKELLSVLFYTILQYVETELETRIIEILKHYNFLAQSLHYYFTYNCDLKILLKLHKKQLNNIVKLCEESIHYLVTEDIVQNCEFGKSISIVRTKKYLYVSIKNEFAKLTL